MAFAPIDTTTENLSDSLVALGVAAASFACLHAIRKFCDSIIIPASSKLFKIHQKNAVPTTLLPDINLDLNQQQTARSTTIKRRRKGGNRSLRSAHVVQGISNLGQTCFANVVLQAQASVNTFVRFIQHASTIMPITSAVSTSSSTSFSHGDENYVLNRLAEILAGLSGTKCRASISMHDDVVGNSGRAAAALSNNNNTEQLIKQLLDKVRMRIDQQEDSHELIIAVAEEVDRTLDYNRRCLSAFFNAFITTGAENALSNTDAAFDSKHIRFKWSGVTHHTSSPFCYTDFFLHKSLRSPFKGMSASQTTCLTCSSKSDWQLECFDVISLLLPPQQQQQQQLCFPSSIITQDSSNFSSTALSPLFSFPSALLPQTTQILLSLSELLTHNFGSCLVHEVACDSCTRQRTRALGLEINDDDEADVENSRQQPTCKSSKMKSTKLAYVPPCVCLHVNRTAWSDSGIAYKRNDTVVFPATLNLTPWLFSSAFAAAADAVAPALHENLGNDVVTSSGEIGAGDTEISHSATLSTAGAGDGNRALCSVVVHHGGANYGHYTTFRRVSSPPSSWTKSSVPKPTLLSGYSNGFTVRHHAAAGNGVGDGDSSNNWVLCDDSFVVPVSLEQQVLLANPYLLYYERG